ncbi:hypothetical protein [Pseudomonas sp. AF32]|uniref:hypothetical protein n=1 Tax=Pseudomonas sp. AF32 TaxID=554390 RepID=UPI001EEF02E7|nr:hypothetical protein [Pseudomonas sp. AF32]
MTIDKQKLQKLLWAEVAAWSASSPDWLDNSQALEEFLGKQTLEEVALELLAENERLAASVKLNLCDYPAIHQGDVDLLVAFVTGTSQMELAKVHDCTPPNISRKIRRVKERIGWREGMSVSEVRDRAEQLRALASRGAVVTADLMVEHDQLKAENEALRKDKARLDAIEAEFWDIRQSSQPNGDAGDSSVGIEIVGRWLSEPCERVIGENYSENLRAAIDQAMKAPGYPPARPEYPEFDDIPDFTPGNGNSARRRAASLGIDYDDAMGKGEQP